MTCAQVVIAQALVHGGDQRTACQSWFSPSTVWAMEIKPRSSASPHIQYLING